MQVVNFDVSSECPSSGRKAFARKVEVLLVSEAFLLLALPTLAQIVQNLYTRPTLTISSKGDCESSFAMRYRTLGGLSAIFTKALAKSWT